MLLGLRGAEKAERDIWTKAKPKKIQVTLKESLILSTCMLTPLHPRALRVRHMVPLGQSPGFLSNNDPATFHTL